MLWLGVDLSTVIPCVGVSQLLIFVRCNVFKIVWLEFITNITKYSHITSVRKTLHWLLIEHCSIFKTASYWCSSVYIVVIQNILYLSLNLDSLYKTCKSQADGVFLVVPYFATYRSTKHFGLSFAYDAPKIWHDLSDDVLLATSLYSF